MRTNTKIRICNFNQKIRARNRIQNRKTYDEETYDFDGNDFEGINMRSCSNKGKHEKAIRSNKPNIKSGCENNNG